MCQFFNKNGLNKTDPASDSLSKVFHNALKALGVLHVVSSTYHPELERQHQTLKSTFTAWRQGMIGMMESH